jgi:hypothetical protein
MTQGEEQEREERKEDFRYKIALLSKSVDMYGQLRPPVTEGKHSALWIILFIK